MRLHNLHVAKKVQRKMLVKHGITHEEAQRAFRETFKQGLRKGRVVVRGKDPDSGKYIVIVGDVKKGVLYAATCQPMDKREKALYKRGLKKRQG